MSEMLIKQITNTWVLKLIPRSTSDMQIHRSIVAEMTGKHFTDLALNGSDIIFTCVCIFLQVRFSGAVKGFRVCAHGLELSVSILLSRKQWHQREREGESWGREGRRERESEGVKCCIPAGSLGTNGNRFIKLHSALFSSFTRGVWTLKHQGRIFDTQRMSVYSIINSLLDSWERWLKLCLVYVLHCARGLGECWHKHKQHDRPRDDVRNVLWSCDFYSD